MKDKKQTILLAGGILITAVLVIVAIVTALRLQQLSSVAPTAPESKPKATTEQKIEKVETRDDDGSIGGGDCGGSPCSNELIIFPGTGDGNFIKVKKLEWQMHDHFENLRYTLHVRGRNNNWQRLQDRVDISGGSGGTDLCGRDPTRARKHPPGTEGEDSCFKLYSANIDKEIDAARFVFSCLSSDCKDDPPPENRRGAHVHIKKIFWTVEAEAQATPTTVQPPAQACTTTFTVAAATATLTPTSSLTGTLTPTATTGPTATPKPSATTTPGPTATATPTKAATGTPTPSPTTIAAASPIPQAQLPEAGVSLPTIAIGLGSLLLIALGLLFAL